MSDLQRKSQPFGTRPALVLVDMFRGFTDAASPLGSECEAVLAASQQLLQRFRQLDLPRYFTLVVYDNDQQGKVFRRRVPALNQLMRGSDWLQFDPRLQPLSGEPIVEKHWPSGFFATDLAEQLQRDKADSLVVIGLTTSGCVRATVLDGLQNDYPVFVPRECVGDRNKAAHDSNLFDMHAKYADVTSLDDILNLLDGRPVAPAIEESDQCN